MKRQRSATQAANIQELFGSLESGTTDADDNIQDDGDGICLSMVHFIGKNLQWQRQPWASLLAHGIKRLEGRYW
jgi:hypothetical protein